MSCIENILHDADVKWKKIGESLVRAKGTKITAGRMKELHKEGAPIKIFAGGKTTAFVDFNDIPEKDVNTKPSIIVKSRGVIEFEYYDKPFSHKNEMWSYHSNDEYLDIKFVYYFLKTQEIYFQNIAGRMQMPQISTPDTEKFKIPIPPLSIQKKIVGILDSFKELTVELTGKCRTELDARNKQFIHYREELFKFEKGRVAWSLLDEIGEFQRGKRFVKTDLISEGVPTIHYGEMYTHYGPWADKTISFISQELVDTKKLRLAEKGDVVIVAAGETIEDIGQGTAWLGNEGTVIHDACFGFRSPLNPKYVAYFTRTRQFHDQIRKHIRTGKISAINSKGLGKVNIPVPSPEEQARIVSILDRFDTLTNSINEAIPKEIELREKQYKYYRDMLLTFPKEKAEV